MLGAATVIQLVATVAMFAVDFDLTLIVFVLVLQMVLVLVYLWDVGKNERIPEGTERVWRLAILLAGPISEPLYYWLYIFGGNG